MLVAPDVLAVLDRAIVSDRAVTLTGQLDRKLYERTNKVLEAAGGRWKRKAKAHVFDGSAAEALEPVFLTGTITSAKQEFGAFYTPPELAAVVIERAALEPGLLVLEPSAGRGALAAPAMLDGCRVDCVEIDPRSVHILCSAPYHSVVEGDFLTMAAAPVYDRVIMNSPFAKGQDCAHVLHAHRFLKPGGRLVAIMSAGILFRVGRAYDAVRTIVAKTGGSIEALPEGSFKSAGTAVSSALVVMRAA